MSSTLIDHIYANNLSNISNSGVISLKFSDHLMTFVGRKINFVSKNAKNSNVIQYRDWKKIKIDLIEEKLNSIDIQSSDVNKLCNDFNEKIHSIIKCEIPLKRKLVKNQYLDEWVDSEILKHISTKNRIQKEYIEVKKAGSDYSSIQSYYKYMKNKTNYLIDSKKRQFFTNKIRYCGNNSTKLWDIIREELPIKTNNKNNNKNHFSSNKLSAEELNDFFTTEPIKIVNEIYNESNDTNIIERNDNSIHVKYSIPNITEENVIKIINNFPLKKSTGSDGIPMRFIKLFKFSLILNIVCIINKSFDKMTFPTAWKISKTFPLYKSGDNNCANNYRPIALLPIFSKITEKYVETTFRAFLTTHKYFSEYQFGFKLCHSTIDALLAIINIVTNSLNSNEKCVIISFDLKKAFDCVDHKILLEKLKNICNRKSHKWFKSYISDRYSFVAHNRKISKPRILKLSVPQGGCLAPLLFIIYMNDISRLTLSGKLFLFADDMSLIIKSKTYNQLQQKINNDLSLIYKWLKNNRLVLNYKKTNYMIMGSPKESSIMNIKPKINDIPIERVFSTKILGLHIDNNLKYDKHLNKLCKELNSKSYLIKRLKSFLSENILNFIYKAIIRPKLQYGCVVWGFTYNIHLEPLVKLQKRFSRIITNSNFLANSSQLFNQLDWVSIKDTIKYESLIYIFKSLNGLNSDFPKIFSK